MALLEKTVSLQFDITCSGIRVGFFCIYSHRPNGDNEIRNVRNSAVIMDPS